MLTVSQLFIYPVKSLGGIAVQEAELTDRGLKYDRRWMLVDEDNCFLSQRSFPKMALLKLHAQADGFIITFVPDHSSFFIPFQPVQGREVRVSVWGDECTACVVDEEANRWFSDKLETSCKLVYMPDESLRPVEENYAKNQEAVSFADAYPVLLIGQKSLDLLNERLTEAVSIDRFRPNIVFTGADAHFEDQMAHFTINNINFYGVKPCARCVMIGINQQTAQTYKEPMKTLAQYRTKNKKVYFGQNLLYQGGGLIRTGADIHLIKTSAEFIPLSNPIAIF